jgi:hypothetical protein
MVMVWSCRSIELSHIPPPLPHCGSVVGVCCVCVCVVCMCVSGSKEYLSLSLCFALSCKKYCIIACILLLYVLHKVALAPIATSIFLLTLLSVEERVRQK